jgi:hypothetical protein
MSNSGESKKFDEEFHSSYYDQHGEAINFIYTDVKGRMIVSNGEYYSQVDYNPWTGQKAKLSIEEYIDPDDREVITYEYIDDDGRMMVTNDEYNTQVNYNPWTGKKAKNFMIDAGEESGEHPENGNRVLYRKWV